MPKVITVGEDTYTIFKIEDIFKIIQDKLGDDVLNELNSSDADLFERKMKVINTDVCGYAKGYVVRYNRENKERQTLIYMYNDKLYPVEDVLFCEEEE